MNYKKITVIATLLFGWHVVQAQTVQDYAKECDALIGQSVPTFNCDDGELVPDTHANHPTSYGLSDSKCDRPNQLNQACDPGSRFQVLFNNENAYAVAHCRKKGGSQPAGASIYTTIRASSGNFPGTPHSPLNHALIKPLLIQKDSLYGDVAVIQHNKKNGVTCFYQSMVSNNGEIKPNGDHMVNGKLVPAPLTYTGPKSETNAFVWREPSSSCVSCHDAGPLIRSPYLAQLKGQKSKGKDPLPWLLADGSADFQFNSKSQPYNFTGDAFMNMKVYSLESDQSGCTGCHNMGIGGSSTDFGLRATGLTNVPAKNNDSAASPLWMPYNHPAAPDSDAQKEAQALYGCAQDSNQPGCHLTLHGGYIKPPLVIGKIKIPDGVHFPKQVHPVPLVH